MTSKEFRTRVEKILADDNLYITFDELNNETSIGHVKSRISLDDLLSLSRLTNTNSIVYETETGWYGDVSHGITIYGFSLSEDEDYE